MAIVDSGVMKSIETAVVEARRQQQPLCWHDPVLQLAERVRGDDAQPLLFPTIPEFGEQQLERAAEAFQRRGIVGVCAVMFGEQILGPPLPVETERRILAVKKGFPQLPATTMQTLFTGFGIEVPLERIRALYCSYGLNARLRPWQESIDFAELNRRLQRLAELLRLAPGHPALVEAHQWYERLRLELVGETPGGAAEIAGRRVGRSLLLHHLENFECFGVFGLWAPMKPAFRESKIGLAREGRMVVDKLQHPDRELAEYVRRLQTRGVQVSRSSITKLFARWPLAAWEGPFPNDLPRLAEAPQTPAPWPEPGAAPERYVEQRFAALFGALDESPLRLANPLVLVLWAYLEELGILGLLEQMGLTRPPGARGYSWLDMLLLDIGRRFYGIPTHSRACQVPESSLPFFCHLYRLPCNDTFLGVLASITPARALALRQYLVHRARELALIPGRAIGFDFHQIDQDVLWERLRGFGRGPSPKKKVCHSGFRPHIAVDVQTHMLIAAEFRKSSARGTTTVRRFVEELIAPELRELFETVYLDSEYTGKDVWSFILDAQQGLGAHLCACLKQNPLVRRARDAFLGAHQHEPDFWVHYDEDHVHSRPTFRLLWTITREGTEQTFELACVVKRHLKTGRLRCFGTSKHDLDSRQILADYSHRWSVENVIKDLVLSYYLDQCPGTDPHAVDVHFLVITICRMLYAMISRDLGGYLKNPDGTTKSLERMRNHLIRLGSGTVSRTPDALRVDFDQAFALNTTNALREWFELLEERHGAGLSLTGGLPLRFVLRPPLGEEYRNTMEKVRLADAIGNTPAK